MFSGFRILTFTHKHCNLRDISRFMVQCDPDETLQSKLTGIKFKFGLSELMYLSTCNRVMYLLYADNPNFELSIPDFLNSVHHTSDHPIQPAELDAAEYYAGTEAINHILNVACSLDSMVVGEREILRQLRLAYEQSREWGLSGDNTRLVMRLAIQAAKDVFTNTQIGDKPVSVVSLAIQQLLEKKPCRESRILMIGAGQTHLLVSKFLLKHGYQHVTVFNRSISKALTIAGKFGQQAYKISDLGTYSDSFDVIIICTAAREPILTGEVFSQLNKEGNERKLVIDLAVPANVGMEVQSHSSVDYIDVELLRQISNQNLNFRKEEMTKASHILQRHFASFRQVFHQRLIERAMSDVPRDIKAMRNKAVNEIFRKDLDSLDPKSREIVDSILNYMEKKSISIPIKAVKEIMLPGVLQKKTITA